MARLPNLSSVKKPSGWRNESHRHYLAAKGISTKRSVRSNKDYFSHSRFDDDFKIVTSEPRHSFFRRRPKGDITADFVLAPEDNIRPVYDEKVVHNHESSFEAEERKLKLRRSLLESNIIDLEARADVARDQAEAFDKRLESGEYEDYASVAQASEDAWTKFQELSEEAYLLRGELIE